MNYRRKNRFSAEGVYLVSLGCPKNLVDRETFVIQERKWENC